MVFAVFCLPFAGNCTAFRAALGEDSKPEGPGPGDWGAKAKGFGGAGTRFNDSTFLDFDSSRGRKEGVQVLAKRHWPAFLSAVKITKCFSCIPPLESEKRAATGLWAVGCEVGAGTLGGGWWVVGCGKAKRQKVSMNVKVNK